MTLLTLALAVLPSLALTGVGATYHVARGAPNASDASAGTAEQPWATMAHAAEVLEAGDRVVVHAGIYREHVLPRHSGREGAPIVYEAAPGEEVIITGADVLTSWERVEGDAPVYRVPWAHQMMVDMRDGKPVRHHPADEEHVRSGRAEQVIVDGQVWDHPQLVLALAEMTPGTFFPDPDAGFLYVRMADGSSPSTHEIEGSTRGLLFGANPWMQGASFDHVVVRGFTFRYGATFPQRPGVWLLGEANTLEDCTIEWMAGGGAGVGPKRGVMRRCVVRHCGHTGGCAGGEDFVNQGCTWEDNCRKPISRGWDAGGVKLAVSHHGLFDRCIFRGNGGPGLWFDIDVNDTIVRQCLFENNEHHGLFIEISRDITVEDCAFFRNALRSNEGWSTAGLTIAESRHCTVVHNLLVGNLDGIALREQGPRYLDTADLGRVPFQNVGHIIAGNISANNQRYQLGLWYDTAFFGTHPGEKDKYANEEEFAAAIQRDQPDRWFDPLQQGMTFAHNAYFAAAGQKLFLYGVPWRARFQEFADVASLAAATGFEAGSLVVDPGLSDLGAGRFELPRTSELFAQGFGPRWSFAR